MKLTGHESSILAFLAQRPNALDSLQRYLGHNALLIAQYLVNPGSVVPPEVKSTGDAINAWAKLRAERERAGV